MANQKEYKIIINGIKESIDGIATLQDSLEKLGTSVQQSGGHFKAASKSMDELAKTEKKIKEYNEEYQTALQSNKMVLSSNAKAIKEKLDIEKAELIVSENLRNTYAQKQQLLTAMGKVIRNTAGDTSELQAQYAALNQELKDFDAGMGNHQRNVGDYAQATKNLKQELREYQMEMADMLNNGVSKADPAFVELAKKAGALKDAIGDAGEEVKRFASDTKKFDDVIDIAQSATAAFGLYKGAMSALGMETEETEKAIQKLAGAMTVIQSLKQLSDSLQNGSMTAKLFNNSLGLLTKGMQGASLGAKALRIALMGIGIGIIIGLVATLIANWESLVGWFQKTFPVLNNLQAKIVGVGKAIKEFLIELPSAVADAFSKLFAGDWDGAVASFKGALDKAKKAYNDGFQGEMTATAAEQSHKRTEQELKELKIQERNNKTYSKKYIDLQKKSFAERKAMARGNKEELNKIRLEEMQFFADVEDKKTAAARAAASQRAKDAKKAAEDQKKAEEKAAEERLTAEEAYYTSIKNLIIQRLEQEKALAEADVERYSSGPIEIYTLALNNLNKVVVELQKETNGLDIYGVFKDYEKNLPQLVDGTADVVTRMKDFLATLNIIQDNLKGKELNLDNFKEAIKSLGNFTEDEIKLLFSYYTRSLQLGERTAKTTVANIEKVQKEALDKEMDEIEKTTLKYELEEDKKSDTANRLVVKLNTQWDNYLQHVKQVYTEDSKEYLEAQKKKQQAIKNLAKPSGSTSSWGYEDLFGEDFSGKMGKQMGELGKKMGDYMSAAYDLAIDPMYDAFSMLMQFQVEEAQEALDEITSMHDKSIERVEESKSKINQIKSDMTSASAAELEQMKSQQADEMFLLAQREAEEKRLAAEKAKREKELEEKQKQQKKLELKMDLVQAISSNALAIVRALTLGPILGPIFAALIGAMGAIQIAVITKQMSKLADGGLLQGKSHSQGGIPVGNTGIEVEGGEYVVNKRSTKKYLPLLQRINEEGARHKTVANQIGKFADGGRINTQRMVSNIESNRTEKVITDAIGQINMQPVVSVVDIAKGVNDLAQVRQLAGGSSLLRK